MSLKSKRQNFVKDRAALADEEFLSRCAAGAPRFALAAREALGGVCQIPADRIYPEDNPEMLAQLVGDWDDLSVILELEATLHISLGDAGDDFPRFLPGRFFWRKWPAPKSVGEWAALVAEHVHLKQDAKTAS
jgi:hypothetical protein